MAVVRKFGFVFESELVLHGDAARTKANFPARSRAMTIRKTNSGRNARWR